MPKLKIEDLKAIREKVKRTTVLRSGKGRAKIVVHMGTCGIAVGARVVMSAFLEKLEQSGVSDIILTSSGCAGLCNHEPMITVEMLGEAPVKYVKLDKEKSARIFDEHVMQGKPVVEYALSMGSETTY